MKIKDIEITPALFFAPLAGYSDKPTRQISRKYGAEAVFTEFISSEGLIRGSEKTRDYLDFDEKERPLGVQIFGHRAEAMSEAAAIIEEDFAPDIIDINMGCSVKKVVKKGAGAALMKDPGRATKITRATVKATNLPVTVKIRSGWNHNKINFLSLGQKLEQTGIQAISIHPRTASDGFSNTPNYDHIKQLKESVHLPVIGNGNIDSIKRAQKVLEHTKCDGIMIGRWGLGNPWLFSEINKFMRNKEYQEPDPTPIDKINLCLNHLKSEENYRGPKEANKIMKKFYKWYFKGFYKASNLRSKLVHSENIDKTREILDKYKNNYKLN